MGNLEQHAGIKREKLFAGSCTALIATAMTFAVLGAIMNPLKEQFLLNNEQVGIIKGAGLWGFPISIMIFGPLCSVLGMRFLLRLALAFFVIGVGTMVFATGFWMLFIGALTIAFANGLVEGACNPLVATLYPDRKVEKLNNFHVWFPGGIVIGAVACYFLDKVGIVSWQLRLLFILVPAFASAAMMFFETFPVTERAHSGVSFGSMVKEAFSRPLFILLFFCMMLTASLELGPNSWVAAMLERGGMPGILVLAYISLLMAVMRQCAGSVVARISPTGILLTGTILAGIGLVALSYCQSMILIFVAATVFSIGVCYFWPTMLGVASERVPKGGELALALLGFAGNVAVGIATIPLMGTITDSYIPGQLPFDQTVAVVQRISQEVPQIKSDDPDMQAAINDTVSAAKAVLAQASTTKVLPVKETATTLRGVQLVDAKSPLAAEAKKLLDPAELYGGRKSFLWVSSLAVVLLVVFGALYLRDKAAGGYRAEKITG